MANIFISVNSKETGFWFTYTWHKKLTQTPANHAPTLSWKVAEGFDVVVRLLSLILDELGSNLDIDYSNRDFFSLPQDR
jgi:hypothetical protein